ncbi:MAG: site-specific DNA-methyltransferase [Candidatus Sumerlaeaceae bacterium]
MARKARTATPAEARPYAHPEADVALRPDVGTQAQFKKKKAPKTYRYDSSLSPELNWDSQNGARGLGEWLLARIEEAAALPAPHQFSQPQEFTGADGAVLVRVAGLQDAVAALKRIESAFLNWTGKAERLSFDVPTLPLFVHERLSTKAIIETLKTHRKDAGFEQADLLSMFGDPQHPVSDQVLRAYEYRDDWVNRMILGDSLVVMNSLLEYESLGGQVQMIYMDPPYGVKFGSNFQPFVRKRDVSHGDDDDFTREPEMVQAYRDTWELGLHSYLTYLRDRLLVARELLTSSGSIFVQISDENLHHVREVMDEVFGAENCCGVITFVKTTGFTTNLLPKISDYLLWYSKDIGQVKFRQVYSGKLLGDQGTQEYTSVELPDGSRRSMTTEERQTPALIPAGARAFRLDTLVSQGATSSGTTEYAFGGITYSPSANSHWKTTKAGLDKLATMERLSARQVGKTLCYVRYVDDFAAVAVGNVWMDMASGDNQTLQKLYVVQTLPKVVQRCMLMTTDPGDLVLDPTCGSGTTAYVAEQWGRRWITTDVSRVPLALARQRVLTATFPWYELKDESRGPAGGFVYKRKQNKKGEEVGGIVPHITLGSIANDEPPKEEVLVDRPEEVPGVVRVSGNFCVEATIPGPVDMDRDGEDDRGVEAAEEHASFVDRMIEVIRRSPVIQIGGGKTVKLEGIRAPAKTLSLSAEAEIKNGESAMVAILFGPQNGAVSERMVHEALREADLKRFTHLYVIGFAIQPNARALIENAKEIFSLGATYVQATLDITMGDLLKNMRSSQIFSVCGLPDVGIAPTKDGKFQVTLLGLDTFDPSTMESRSLPGDDVPAWFLDTDYNGLCFHVSQAFFPRTSAWESLKKALKATHEESVWDHLAGTTSAPFEPGEHKTIAVKVIDDRGNELLVIKALKEIP